MNLVFSYDFYHIFWSMLLELVKWKFLMFSNLSRLSWQKFQFYFLQQKTVNWLEKTILSLFRISSMLLYYLICSGQLMVRVPNYYILLTRLSMHLFHIFIFPYIWSKYFLWHKSCELKRFGLTQLACSKKSDLYTLVVH